jgi:hypothetical protein
MKIDHDGVRLSDGHQMIPFIQNPSTDQQTIDEMRANAIKYSMNAQQHHMFSPTGYGLPTDPLTPDMYEEFYKNSNGMFLKDQSYLLQMVILKYFL